MAAVRSGEDDGGFWSLRSGDPVLVHGRPAVFLRPYHGVTAIIRYDGEQATRVVSRASLTTAKPSA